MSCGRKLAKGQWWHFCGETDMGQTMPVLCEECEPGGLQLLTQTTEQMNQQDEGRIDPRVLDEMREHMANLKPQGISDVRGVTSGGISEFARLEEEREELIAQGVPEEELETPLRHTHVLPGGVGIKVELTAQEAAPFVEPTTKDTNPKDAIGAAKPNYTNVPVPVLYEVGAAMTEGACKYAAFNYRIAGVRTSVYIGAARRHIDAYLEGENMDPDSGLSHLSKAIASLVVLRDAEMNGMIRNDDRPPSAAEGWMGRAREDHAQVTARFPNPKAPYTQVEIAHMRNTPTSIYAGQTLGFEVEVMLPADGHPEGFVWMRQGDRRTDLDLSLAVAQALREDGYGQRVIRITRVADRIEQMQDTTEYVAGELREPVTTVFPGDPSLMEATEEEATELSAELTEEEWGNYDQNEGKPLTPDEALRLRPYIDPEGYMPREAPPEGA